MTLDEAVEGLYDLERNELLQLALECLLIARDIKKEDSDGSIPTDTM